MSQQVNVYEASCEFWLPEISTKILTEDLYEQFMIRDGTTIHYVQKVWNVRC